LINKGGIAMPGMTNGISDFDRAIRTGRPPNVVKLFPNSKALIVSGKFIDRAMMAKGKAITMAANGRSNIIIRGVLQAAQRANSTIIIEIAKSEGGSSAYCAVNYWNIARQADARLPNRRADQAHIARSITGILQGRLMPSVMNSALQFLSQYTQTIME